MNKKLTTFLALALSLVMICSTPLSALASDDLSYSSIAESPQVTCEDTSDTSAEIPDETVAEDPEDPSANIPAEPLIESPSEKHVEFQINPIYSDIFSPEDFSHTEPSGESLVGKDRLNATSIEEFTTLYRNAFNELARSRCDNIDSYKSVTVYCTLERDTVFTDEEMDAIEKQCDDIAMATQILHTGDPVLGDYASYHVSSLELSSGKYVYCDVDDPNFPDVPYYLEVEVTTKMWYLSTTAQENAVTSKLKTVMSSLNLGSKSDYQKIRAIYDYITSHVKYDNNHDNYPVEYTAYGALVKGKAACQGIASLFYRMALEAGLDARIIPGDSTGDGITDHAWNIVRLDGKYYNVDATWDLGNKPANYEYFLKCQKSFPFHYRESDYKTAAFNKKYPMATSDYRNLFDDVKDSSHPYFAAIYWAAGKGITNGYTGTNTFGINDACTRSQAMMFLWKMAGKPAPKAGVKNPFTDLKSSHPHYRAIMWSYSYGIAKGFPNHTYGVDVACTRGQIMTFIWRYAGQPSPKSTKSPFKDKLTPAYRTAILWGSEKGITKGYSDGTFKDSVICTRGQIVTFLYRIRSWGYKAA